MEKDMVFLQKFRVFNPILDASRVKLVIYWGVPLLKIWKKYHILEKEI